MNKADRYRAARRAVERMDEAEREALAVELKRRGYGATKYPPLFTLYHPEIKGHWNGFVVPDTMMEAFESAGPAKDGRPPEALITEWFGRSYFRPIHSRQRTGVTTFTWARLFISRDALLRELNLADQGDGSRFVAYAVKHCMILEVFFIHGQAVSDLSKHLRHPVRTAEVEQQGQLFEPEDGNP